MTEFYKKFFTSNLRIRSSFVHFFVDFYIIFLKFWNNEQYFGDF
jgi:hypothetical protein